MISVRGFSVAAMMALLLALIAVTPTPASAQAGMTVEADTMIQWGDYDVFNTTAIGPAGAKQCASTCAGDQRCKAWTYIKTTAQCRLKHAVGNVVHNTCCVSGQREVASNDGSREAFCADYATAAVDAFDKNQAERCGYGGNRWTGDYQRHYDWCLASPKKTVVAETAARVDLLTQCTESASTDDTPLCDHYARVAAQQSQTNVKAGCAFTNARRWNTDVKFHLARCIDDPTIVESETVNREKYLRQCFERSGDVAVDCNGYADKAVAQVQSAAARNCEFEETKRWSASFTRHYNWCQQASSAARDAEIAERDKAIRQCVAQAGQAKACADYAVAAVEQARKNDNANCGFDGPRWSLYRDDHVEACMAAPASFRAAERGQRDTDLARCIHKPKPKPAGDVADICDQYAKAAIEQNDVNVRKKCRLVEPRIWNADYSVHYDLCLAVSGGKRVEIMRSRTEALRECGRKKGLQFELNFNFN